ncbi:hypothetical protein L1276_001735 [Flavobacterium sp. HSC-32F16]|uniref:hypothetical protein n=1 Tax=Flavobacterium sp. HSC-32F16 TaxID=2910964 RepID=UPI0020A36778|nr:hypothetical protein [Flavobacterium sp. HSC-32F16]MCP2026591.1 hypothetical protein [Flavobacterium sp. HSC-32F16]
MKHTLLAFIIVILAVSCKKETDKVSKTTKPTTKNASDSSSAGEEEEIFDSGVLAVFPKTGKKAQDFVIEPYEIQLQAEGFLNDDELKDIVIVLNNKNDNTDIRAALVLIKQQAGGYVLQETSWHALNAEYSYEGYKPYDYENIEIDKDKILRVTLQGIGPVGTRQTEYKYINNELVLTKIHTFNMGAGSQIGVDYDLINGVAEAELINTMVDSMPSTTQKKNFKLKRQQLFVDDNPDRVLNDLPEADW